jgi:hypothetical protein
MLHWILVAGYIALMSVCIIAVAGLALLLWDDISAERKYRSRRDF